jgi:hypothetical protein
VCRYIDYLNGYMQTQQRHASQIKEKSPLSLSLALPLIIKMLKSMSVFYFLILISLRFGPVVHSIIHVLVLLVYFCTCLTSLHEWWANELLKIKSQQAPQIILINKISPFYHQLAILWVLVCVCVFFPFLLLCQI